MQQQSATLCMVIMLYAMANGLLPVILLFGKVTLTTNDIQMNPSPLSAADSHKHRPAPQDLWSCQAKAQTQFSICTDQLVSSILSEMYKLTREVPSGHVSPTI